MGALDKMLTMSETKTGSSPDRGAADWFLWGALLVAFSPVLVDLGRHWFHSDWARYSIVFVPLLVWAVRRSPAQEPRRGLGWTLVAFSFVIELVAAKGAMIEIEVQ